MKCWFLSMQTPFNRFANSSYKLLKSYYLIFFNCRIFNNEYTNSVLPLHDLPPGASSIPEGQEQRNVPAVLWQLWLHNPREHSFTSKKRKIKLRGTRSQISSLSKRGVKGLLRDTWLSVFNFRERWKYEIKTRELWLVCLSWYVNFKIFYPIFVIFN